MTTTELNPAQQRLADVWEQYIQFAQEMPDDGMKVIYLELPGDAEWLFLDTTGEWTSAYVNTEGPFSHRDLIGNPQMLAEHGATLLQAAMQDGRKSGRFSRISPDFANGIQSLLVSLGVDAAPVPERLGWHYVLKATA